MLHKRGAKTLQAFKHIAPLSYFIRRIVCPAVLVNCAESRIMLPSIFKAVLGTRNSIFVCAVSVVYCVCACGLVCSLHHGDVDTLPPELEA